jgi:UDP-galactopyranose mutase
MLNSSEFKCVIVGSGLFELTLAERIANVLKLPVLVIEKREYIGGSA